MSESTITSKGQVTIPADIRKALDLAAGERVVFTQLDDGTTARAQRLCQVVQANQARLADVEFLD